MKRYFYLAILLSVAAPCAAQWQPDSELGTSRVIGFYAVDTNLFASLAGVQFPYGDTNALLRYTPGQVDRHDEGTAVYVWTGWTECDMNHYILPKPAAITAMARIGPYIFAADNGGILKTTDLGKSWVGVGKDSTGNWITGGNAIVSIGRVLMCGSYRSTDSGRLGSWKYVQTPSFSQMAVIGSNIIGGSQYGIWYSDDSGLNWTLASNAVSSSFAIIDSTIFSAGVGLVSSTDYGKSWNVVGSLSYGGPDNCVAADGKNVFVGTYDSGVVVSTDRGNSWYTSNTNLRDLWINRPADIDVGSICVSDSQVWVNVIIYSDYRWSTFHRPISEMVSNSSVLEPLIASDSIEIYPNPTNGQVSILAGGTSILGVRVLNVLGESVFSAPEFPAHRVPLDLSRLTAGTYFIEIETPMGTVLRKLVKE